MIYKKNHGALILFLVLHLNWNIVRQQLSVDRNYLFDEILQQGKVSKSQISWIYSTFFLL